MSAFEAELRHRRARLDARGHGARQRQREAGSPEEHAAVLGRRLVAGPAVVEGGPAHQPEGQRAPHGRDHADEAPRTLQLRRLRRQRHEVDQLGHSIRMEEAGDEHVGVRQIHLAARESVEARADLPRASPLVVEQGGKDARRIDTRHTAPVDGAVGAH